MKQSFKELINQDVPVLVDFYADWCGPCQSMAPVLKEVAGELKGKVKIIKIDVDKNQPVAQKFGVRGIPHFVLFKSGKVVTQKAGMMTKRDLTQMILVAN
jgi:thioredoxin 1